MKATITEPKARALTTMKDMKPGQLGVITDNDEMLNGHVVLRFGEVNPTVLSLTDTGWKFSADADVVVRILPVGTEVTLTQEAVDE